MTYDVAAGPDDWVSSVADLAPQPARGLATDGPDDWVLPPAPASKAAPAPKAAAGADDWIVPPETHWSTPPAPERPRASAIDVGTAALRVVFPGVAAARDLTRGTEFEKGFTGSLIGTNPKLMGDAAEGLGTLLGNDTIRNAGTSISQYGADVLEGYKPRVPSFTDIRTDSPSNFLADLGSYAGYSAGSGIGTSAPSLVTGTLASLATANPLVGLAVGAALPSYIQNYGDVYGSSRDDPGIKARVAAGDLTPRQLAGTAAIAAVPMAALDVVGLETVLGGTVFAEAKRDLGRRIIHGIALGAITEGTTEGLQEVISQWAQHYLGSQTSMGEKVIQVVDNVFGGVFAGGPMGGVGAMAARGAPGAQPRPMPPGAAPLEGEVLPPEPPPPGGYPADESFAEAVKAFEKGELDQSDPLYEPVRSWYRERLYGKAPGPIVEGEATPVLNTNLLTQGAANDRQGGPGIPGEVGGGQEPLQAGPVQGAGGEAAGTGRLFQAPEAGPLEDQARKGLNRFELAKLLEDPRSAAEIRADLEAQRRADEDAARHAAAEEAVGAAAAEAGAQHGAAFEPPVAPPEGTREAPVRIETPEDVTRGAEITATPTPAQAEANNYRHRHIQWRGLDISIETEAGQERTGIGEDGKPWSAVSPTPYGYFKGASKAKDGDHIDVYIGNNPSGEKVFVIDQVDLRGKYDEAKVVIGVASKEQAQRLYRSAFPDGSGAARMGAVTEMTIRQFKTWLAQGNTKRPLAYDQSARIPRLASNEEAVPEPQRQELSRLRGQRDQHSPNMGGELSGVSSGRGAAPIASPLSGPISEGARQLRAGERPVGDAGAAGAEPPRVRPSDHVPGENADRGGVGSRAELAGAYDLQSPESRIPSGKSVEGRPPSNRQESDAADTRRTDIAAHAVGETSRVGPNNATATNTVGLAGRKGSDGAAEPRPPGTQTASNITPKAPEAGPSSSEANPAGQINAPAAPANVPPAKPTGKRGPQSLLEFLAARGGIKDHGGELRHMGLTNKFLPGYGKLVRPAGMSLDRAREAAVEAKYLRDAGEAPGAVSTSTVDQLLTAIDAEHRGRKVYSERDLGAVAARAEAAQAKENAQSLKEAVADVRDVAKAEGFTITDQEAQEAAHAALTQGIDPLEALVNIMERNAVAAEGAEAQNTEPEAAHGREARPTAANQSGAKPAQAIEPARPDREGTAGEAPARVEPREDQRTGREAANAGSERTAGSERGAGAGEGGAVGEGARGAGAGARVEPADRKLVLAQRARESLDLFHAAREKLAQNPNDEWLKANIWSIEKRMLMDELAYAREFEPERAREIRAFFDKIEGREPEAPKVEPGAEGRPQILISGVEPITDRARLEAQAGKPLKPKVAQKEAGGLFSDESKQTDLIDMARSKAREPGPSDSGASSGGKPEAQYSIHRPQYSFGGAKSLTADRGRLAEAQRMSAAGASREEVFKKTGWYNDIDGNWKFYISDEHTKLKPDALLIDHLPERLDNVIEAPNLFSAYPHLNNVRVVKEDLKGKKGGHWDILNKEIVVETKLDQKQILSTIIHEVQHAIQDYEGFAPGANPDSTGVGQDRYMRSAGEVEARNAEFWARIAQKGLVGRLIVTQNDALVRLDEAQKANAPKAVIARLKKELKQASEQQQSMGTIGGVNYVGSEKLADELKAARKTGASQAELQRKVDEYQKTKLTREIYPWETRDTLPSDILLPPYAEEMHNAEERQVTPREIKARFKFEHREPLIYHEAVSLLYSANGSKRKLLNWIDTDLAKENLRPFDRLQKTKLREYVESAVTPDEGRQAASIVDLTPAARQRRADIERMLTQVVEKITGRNTRVEFSDKIPVNVTGWGSHGKGVTTAAGVYIPGQALIRLAMADPAYTGSPMTTAFHESFHAVENQLLTDKELALLKRETERLRKFLNERVEGPAAQSTTWADDLADYEVRAIAFEMYGMRRAQGKPLDGFHTGIARMFNRLLLLLQRIRNALSGLGFKTAEDIFAQAYEGEMAGRGKGRGEPASETQVAPQAEPKQEDEPSGEFGPVAKTPEELAQRIADMKPHSNKWIAVPEGEIYVRIGERPGIGSTLEIPNIEFREESRGTGAFTKYLDAMEKAAADRDLDAVYVEQLFNKRLEQFLRRRGYRNEPRAGGALAFATSNDDQATLYKSVGGPKIFIPDEPYRLSNGQEPTSKAEIDTADTLAGVDNNHNRALREVNELLGLFRREAADPYYAEKLERWEKVATLLRQWKRDGVALAGKTMLLSEWEKQDHATAGNPQHSIGRPRMRAEGEVSIPAETINARLEARNIATLGRIGDFNTTEARTQLQDKFIRWQHIQRAVEDSTGEKLPESMNVYMAESLYYGRTGQRLEELEKKFIDPMIAEIKRQGLTVGEVNRYLMARHAPERNAKVREINPDIESPSGMSDEEAKEILDAIDDDGNRDAYEAVERKVRALIDETRVALLAGGLIDRETFDTWERTYKHYVPLRGFAEDSEAEDTHGHYGKGYDVRGPESKRALGRSSLADGPVAYAMLQAQQAIVRAEKAQVGRTAMRFVNANPLPGLWKIDKGDTKRVIDPRTGLVTNMVDPLWRTRDNVFALKVGGDTYFINFQGEHGAKLARALKNLGTANLHPALKLVSTLTRLQARLATSWNPDFMIPNLVRDMGEAFINMQEQDKKTFTKQFAKHLRSVMGGAFLALTGREGGKYAQAFREFDEAGGRIRFFGLEDVEDIKKNVASKMRRLEGGAVNNMIAAGEKAMNAIEIANATIENATRLAVYMAARDVGMTKAKAASVAREITVNFNRKGELGSIISALYMFANASMQGSTRMVTALKGSKNVRRAAYTVAGVGAALALYNIGSGGDDDDGIPYYLKLPSWERDTNMILMWPKGMGHDGQYVKIPLPYGYSFFHTIGARMMAMGFGKEKPAKSVGAMASSVLDAFDPLGKDENMLAQFAPSLTRPVVHLATNKNWTGRPINPEPMPWNRNEPDASRYFRSASPFAIAAADQINRATGGTKHQSGLVDWSPGTIDYMLGFVIGGLGRFALNANTTAMGLYNGTEWQVDKTPIVRRFCGVKSDAADRQLYFEEREKVTAAQARRAAYGKDGNYTKQAEFESENRPELDSFGEFKRVDNQRRDIRKDIDEIKANDKFSPREKERRVKLKEREELDLMLGARRTLQEQQRATAH